VIQQRGEGGSTKSYQEERQMLKKPKVRLDFAQKEKEKAQKKTKGNKMNISKKST